MRKIVAFDWNCPNDEYMEDKLNLPVRMPLYTNITVVENPLTDLVENEPYVVQCLDPSDNNTIVLHFLDGPGFIFDDNTYLRFNNVDQSMTDKQFIQYVYKTVVEYMKDYEPVPEICELDDIIF